MRQIKVSDLDGEVLDWAVAVCEKLLIKYDPMDFKSGSEAGYWIWDDDAPRNKYMKIGRNYSPSTIWDQASSIIERDVSFVERKSSELWCAGMHTKDMRNGGWFHGYGHTPLIAVMRCLVASKFGDVVDIPEVLLGN